MNDWLILEIVFEVEKNDKTFWNCQAYLFKNNTCANEGLIEKHWLISIQWG